MKKYLILVVLYFVSNNSYSSYCATGTIEGNVCKGFIIESCKFIEVNAVKNNGTFYTMNRCYETVSDHKNGLCWIRTRASGIISKGLNAAFQPDFYNYKNGKYTSLDVDFLVFKCTKQ